MSDRYTISRDGKYYIDPIRGFSGTLHQAARYNYDDALRFLTEFDYVSVRKDVPGDLHASFDALRNANMRRQRCWPGNEKIDLLFRAVEMGGEAGEVLNKVKKLVRHMWEIKGNAHNETGENLTQDIAEELADVIICCDLLAGELNIDLGEAIVHKFDKTSRKNDIDSYFWPEIEGDSHVER